MDWYVVDSYISFDKTIPGFLLSYFGLWCSNVVWFGAQICSFLLPEFYCLQCIYLPFNSYSYCLRCLLNWLLYHKLYAHFFHKVLQTKVQDIIRKKQKAYFSKHTQNRCQIFSKHKKKSLLWSTIQISVFQECYVKLLIGFSKFVYSK